MSNTFPFSPLDERAMITEGAEVVDSAHAGSVDAGVVAIGQEVSGVSDDLGDDDGADGLVRVDAEALTDSDG